MVKIDLITGFLGSGKTTFLKKYAKYLIDKGQNIGILENDYGAVNVDMMLLQDLEGELCELEMVAGGCDYDCHRRRFKTKLIAMGMLDYDRVLVEPSGIFDVDEFFDVLFEEPLNQWYEIGNVITIVDAGLEETLSEQSEYLLAVQAASAGCILLSKSQETNEDARRKTIDHLRKALEKIHCSRSLQEKLICKEWSEFENHDLEKILCCGYEQPEYVKQTVDRENAFQSVYFLNVDLPLMEVQKRIQYLMNSTDCGNVFRVKGFLQENNEWVEINATRQNLSIQKITLGQQVLIVIGEHLDEEKIRNIFV